ncbi:DUF4132 domain-containing protein [Glycomyces paridis]|uniref:DUF4132 domain-containing protein n=1 Tax=Glycomyces paridis TaxID=2126555 RepID=A0A4S8PQ60_9ACTN|nr:DUF4132 domain-containing protein [Glycomyces paridis]THV30699.1 DUF4132 domain-containing protein [Glycomyces paridis]
MPAAWKGRLLPRRGKRTGKAGVLEPEASNRRRQKIAARLDKLRTALARPENEAYADAGNAFLDGEADALGAAAVATLMLDQNSRRNDTWLRPDFDFWVQQYGLAFAVAAAVERLPLCAVNSHGISGGAADERNIQVYGNGYPYGLVQELGRGGVATVRSLLAELPDDEYAAVVAAVAEHRDTPEKRLIATALLPDETAWTDEVCAEYAAQQSPSLVDEVLYHSVNDAGQLTAAGVTVLSDYYTDAKALAALLDGLGAAALPFLTATADPASGVGSTTRKLVLKAIAMLPADEAMTYLLGQVDKPHVFEHAAEAAGRFPVRALRTAITLAPTASAELKARIVAVTALLDTEAREHLTAEEREAVEELLADNARHPEADAADLPDLLVAPPWTVKRPKTKAVVIDGLAPPADTHVRWAEGEREAWDAVESHYDPNYWIEAFEREGEKRSGSYTAHYLAYAPVEKAEPHLADWPGLTSSYWDTVEQRILARFGERVADRVLGAALKDPTVRVLPGPILNLTAARLSAERLARLKSARPSAVEWFARHGLDTVPYLVPDALGTDKARRRYAETALAHLAVHHGPEAVTAAAESYGSEAAEAVAAIVGGDPLEPRGATLPKPGPWTSPVMFPQVLLKGGERALPAASIKHLITVLALATPDYPYAGLDVVAETCDRASLTRFSRALFDQWLAVGSPPKDAWALTQLAHFAEDETVWALAPLIREWPGESQHRRAVVGLGVLGAIGTEEALRAIQGIAEKVKFKALKEEAGRQITVIAAGLGLSREQLADRLVPDFGLGEAATLRLDYGPRSFTVAFDEHLKPFVVDDAGKPRKVLPKPGAKDDPDLADAAYKRFAALKKELRTVAADQVGRLESAMVAARSWTVEEFRRYFVDHALTAQLARRLVWLAEADGARFGFRIAEDGTFSDVEDEEVELPEGAVVRIAHPVHLEPKAVDAWAEVLADYEILQPFDQLTRSTMAFTEDELATGRLQRFVGAKVEVGRVLGMSKRGWHRASPEDAGVEPGIGFRLPGGGFVTVGLEPGIWVGAIGETPEQTVQSVRITDREDYWWRDDQHPVPACASKIDAVTAAEILGSLARLTGTS